MKKKQTIREGRNEKSTMRTMQDYFQSLENGVEATDVQSYLLNSRGELDRAIKLINAFYK